MCPFLAVFADEGIGRTVRLEVLEAGCRVVPLAGGFIADLMEVEVVVLPGAGFGSFEEGAKLARLSEGGLLDFRTGDLTGALAAIDTRLADPAVRGFFFASTDSDCSFGLSSIEVVDSLDLCPVLAAVAALTPCAGLLGTEPAAGRAGGLLKLLPPAVRVVDDNVAFVAGVGAELKGRLAVALRRLGGRPLLRGELGASCWPSLERGDSMEGEDCFLGGSAPWPTSSAGGVDGGGST